MSSSYNKTGLSVGSYFWCVFLLSVGFQSSTIAASSADDRQHIASKIPEIESLIAREYQKDNVGGVTAGIVHNGELIWVHSLGYFDQATQQPVTADTLYPIASVTKIVTGLMLLQLVAENRVHLADPVEKYVPELKKVATKYPWAPPITLIQLATMSAGLGAQGCSIGDLRYAYEPGTQRMYSNQSYCLLGVALSRAAGQDFKQYVTNRILRPLGMTHTQFADELKSSTDIPVGYRLEKGVSAGRLSGFTDQMLAAGGLVSTIGDLSKLMSFQLGHGPDSVLSEEMLLKSYALIVPSDANLLYGDGVGYAAVRNEDSSLVALGHGGSLGGYITSYEFDLSSDTGVILLSNTNFGQANYKILVRKILALLHPDSRGGSGEPVLERH